MNGFEYIRNTSSYEEELEELRNKNDELEEENKLLKFFLNAMWNDLKRKREILKGGSRWKRLNKTINIILFILEMFQ